MILYLQVLFAGLQFQKRGYDSQASKSGVTIKVLSHVTFREHLPAGDLPSSSLMRVIRQSRDPENATVLARENVMRGHVIQRSNSTSEVAEVVT